MDTEYDYIAPEFLNIILFQQKNLVIFPYVDFKHFHSLEVFAVGYNIVDLDSTAIHNIVELLEYENYNSYSQNPTFFFISNVTIEQLKGIMKLDSIHCIVNSNENTGTLESENDFVFYNKKSKKFLNYFPENEDLSFEDYLIKSSQNESILQDKILKVKSIATQIFTELNNSNDKKKLIELLSEFNKKYWEKIILFTEKYYGIEIPELPRIQVNANIIDQEPLDAFSEEYQIIMKSNSKIAQEFIQTLHEYRCRKVNPANLELEQLYKPRDLYIYLRNHHWGQGIPEDFVKEWMQMNNTKCPLTSSDKDNFLTCLIALNIPTKNINITIKESDKKIHDDEEKGYNIKLEPEVKQIKYNEKIDVIPPIKDFPRFRSWILDKLDLLNAELKNNSQ